VQCVSMAKSKQCGVGRVFIFLLRYCSCIAKKVGRVLVKKVLHIVTDATDLIYYPFRTWGFILMVRDLVLEDY
jgi:hypothetical protein